MALAQSSRHAPAPLAEELSGARQLLGARLDQSSATLQALRGAFRGLGNLPWGDEFSGVAPSQRVVELSALLESIAYESAVSSAFVWITYAREMVQSAVADAPETARRTTAALDVCEERLAAFEFAVTTVDREISASSQALQRAADATATEGGAWAQVAKRLERRTGAPLGRVAALMQARDSFDQRLDHLLAGIEMAASCQPRERDVIMTLVAVQLRGLSDCIISTRVQTEEELDGLATTLQAASGDLDATRIAMAHEALNDLALSAPGVVADAYSRLKSAADDVASLIAELFTGVKDAPCNDDGTQNGMASLLSAPWERVALLLGEVGVIEKSGSLEPGAPVTTGRSRLIDIHSKLARLRREFTGLDRDAQAMLFFAESANDQVGQPVTAELVEQADIAAFVDLYSTDEERAAHKATLDRLSI